MQTRKIWTSGARCRKLLCSRRLPLVLRKWASGSFTRRTRSVRGSRCAVQSSHESSTQHAASSSIISASSSVVHLRTTRRAFELSISAISYLRGGARGKRKGGGSDEGVVEWVTGGGRARGRGWCGPAANFFLGCEGGRGVIRVAREVAAAYLVASALRQKGMEGGKERTDLSKSTTRERYIRRRYSTAVHFLENFGTKQNESLVDS